MDVDEDDEMVKEAIRLSMETSSTNPSSGQSQSQPSNKENQTSSTEAVSSDVLNDPDFIHSILTGLPGVNPDDAAIKDVLESFKNQPSDKDKEDKK